MTIAYERNTSLAVDTNVLSKCGDEYLDIANQLIDMATELDNCLLDLKENGWTTEAGSAFQKMTETNWKQNIEKYADLLITLDGILKSATTKYEDLITNHIEQTKL